MSRALGHVDNSTCLAGGYACVTVFWSVLRHGWCPSDYLWPKNFAFGRSFQHWTFIFCEVGKGAVGQLSWPAGLLSRRKVAIDVTFQHIVLIGHSDPRRRLVDGEAVDRAAILIFVPLGAPCRAVAQQVRR